MALRDIHPSYVGKIDLVSTSPGEPGISFVLSPFFKPYPHLHFTETADDDTL